MLQSSSLNFLDPINPKIIIDTRNLTGSADSISEIKFILTGKTSGMVATTIHKAPISSVDLTPYVNTDVNSPIIFIGDTYNVDSDPVTTRYNNIQADSVTLEYDSSLYTTNTNTGFKITFNTPQYNSVHIEINLADLYTFENNKKYGVEAIATNINGSIYSWDTAIHTTLSFSNIGSLADPPINRYLNINTDDIVIDENSNTCADFGFNNITNGNGSLIIGVQLGPGDYSNNTNYSFNLTNVTGGGSTNVSLPSNSIVVLYYYVPLYDNNSGTYQTVTFNDTQFTGGFGMVGTSTNVFSFSNVDTTQPIVLGFIIPTDATITNDIANSDIYQATLMNQNQTIVSTSNTILSCLYEDTEVLTPSGYVSVKTLQENDKVTTSDGRTSKIIKLMISKLPASYNTSPLIIKANSIAENYPPKDCRISKYHMIQYNGEWIAPCKNEHIFKADKSIRSIKYYHIQLENFKTDHLVINDGLVVESLGNGQEDNSTEWQSRCNNSIIL